MSSGSPMPLWFTLWALALLVLQLIGLGGVPLFDVDEGAFAEATRELLASGDWGHTTLNGEDRWDKPILSYWLQAVSVMLFGLDEFALRLPSALAAWLWAVVVAHRVSLSHGHIAALAVGTVLSTSLGVMLIGRAATADALLNLWLVLATLSLRDALRDLAPDADPAHRAAGLRALRLSALWIALGLLTKGPVALLVPGAVAVLWSLSMALQDGRQGAAARCWQRLRPVLLDGKAWVVLLAVATPWYGYALQRHGMAFVDGFLWRHNLQRYGGTLEGHAGAWFYYLLLLPLLLLPWSALLLPLLARLRPLWRDPADRWLLLWAGFVLVFFSASGTKLPHYALYGLTPLAMLGGRWLASPASLTAARLPRVDRIDRIDRVDRFSQWLLVACLALLPLGALWLSDVAQAGIAASTRPADALHALLLAGPGQLDGEAGIPRLVIAALLGAVLGGGSWLAWRVHARSALRPAMNLLTTAVLAAGLTLQLLPWWGERLQAPVKTLAQLARTHHPDRPIVQWGLHQPSFALYLQRPTPRRAPQPGELALVRVDRLASLRHEGDGSPAAALRVLARARGYLLIERPGHDAPETAP
ncbi:ArnT family glycosyltransferase [Sphaerotilus mobilis]|uniref:Dolichyl-phosphate-mannose-protein mannosyltransferase n=1 Tax=Sphaerotilus mobilis TaxID=47994 RepID=A0A4Q7LVW9_9BURK|nr:glycosyltransferase family 39 protein [Sphaerotilus mobilis]RZS58512.1 dolichyl-phosphate-mannose-protein mannosyltransferase [Sphaerotilus mobilis]